MISVDYPLFPDPPHDPSGGSNMRTIEVPVDDGDELLGTSTLSAAVYAGDVLITDTFTISNVAIGRISGNLFGVNFWPRFGTAQTTVLITVTPFYASGLPGVPGEDITVRLRVDET